MNILRTNKINKSTVRIQSLSSKLFGSESQYTIETVRFFNNEVKSKSFEQIEETTTLVIKMIEQDYLNVSTENNSSRWY